MLGVCLPAEIPSAVRSGMRFTVSSMEEAQLISNAAVSLKRAVPVHIKVDTGMGRLGMRMEDAVTMIGAIAKLPGLVMEGLCSHLADAENDARYTRSQLKRFGSVHKDVESKGVLFPWVHVCNSAGLLLRHLQRDTAVRPGLLVYGVVPEGRRKLPVAAVGRLKAALSWKCRVGLVKTLRTGETVSYGRTFRAVKNIKLGVLTAGYGDGYMRRAGNAASVLIRGTRCPVIGRVTMDQMMVDATAVAGILPGDEVVLLGSQGGQAITASQLAGWCDSVPWEVLTGITHRVPRIYMGGQAA